MHSPKRDLGKMVKFKEYLKEGVKKER